MKQQRSNKKRSIKRGKKKTKTIIMDKARNWIEQSLDWQSTIVVDKEEKNTVEEAKMDDDDDGAETCDVDENNDSIKDGVDTNEWINKLSKAINDMESDDIDGDYLIIPIITWNVLASSYCNRKSHPNLPIKAQNHVFAPAARELSVRKTVARLSKLSSLIALQEVDEPLEIRKFMTSLGYDGIETPTTPAGKDGRVDACALYYRNNIWKATRHEIIRFDDIATLRTNKNASTFTKNNNSSTADNTTGNNLQGLQSTFVRRNMGLLVELEYLPIPGQKIIVGVAHLYWNPAHEFVKLCQAHYLLLQAQKFQKEAVTTNSTTLSNIPLIICGDFNSQPSSMVYKYITKGVVNAKISAPWYRNNNSINNEESDHKNNNNNDKNNNNNKNNSMEEELVSNFEQMTILSSSKTQPRVRYMLDFTLNKFCRWLRILGVDAALETDEEEKMRTKHSNIVIFDRCRKENRTLITTSSKLLARSNCPPGAYHLNTKSLANLHVALVHLFLSHGVQLEPSEFLSRCVVCNGLIKAVHDQKLIQEIFAAHQAPLQQETLPNVDVFQCNKCHQGYWWHDNPTSSASRVKNMATQLLELCIRGGVPISDNLGMFDFVSVQNVQNGKSIKNNNNNTNYNNETNNSDLTRESNNNNNSTAWFEGVIDEKVYEKVSQLQNDQLDVLTWLQQERLQNPLGPLQSAYADETTGKELIDFTNVTFGFVGHLDHIFYSSPSNDNNTTLQLRDRLHVPTTFDELNSENIPNGHLLPSTIWPSDHLAIGAKIAVKLVQQPKPNNNNNLEEEMTMTKTEISMIKSSTSDNTTTASTVSSVPNMNELFCGDPSTSFPPALPKPSNPPKTHGMRCDCGCVPNTPSLFEMAELRKQARLKKTTADAAATRR